MKTAIYMRISTEEQDISLQKEAIYRFLQYKQFPIAINYCDKGYSGSNKDREQLTDLINGVKMGAIERIIVWKLDRLSRNLYDLLGLIRLFKEHNVEFYSVTENLDLTTPFGQMAMGILGIFGEFERNVLIERTKAGMKAKKAQGVHLGRSSSTSKEIEERIINLRKYEGYSYNELVRDTGLTLGRVKGVLKRNKLLYFDQLDKIITTGKES